MALISLGIELYLGRGANKNARNAVEYFSVATLLGVPNASHNLGVAYYEGYGVKKNKSEAYRLIRIAAEQGDFSARKALGWDKLPNPNGPSSFKEAREWLEDI